MDKLSALFVALAAPLSSEVDTNIQLAALKALVAALEHKLQVDYTAMIMRDQMGGGGSLN